MLHIQEELNNMDELQKFEFIIDCIQKAVDIDDRNQIAHYIAQELTFTKNLMKDLNFEKILYLGLDFFNKIISTDIRVKTTACEDLHQCFESAIADINFEKQSLLEIRKFLLKCGKNDNYMNLPLAFNILYMIGIMHNSRRSAMPVHFKSWECGISGIEYMPPVPIDTDEERLREPIELGIQKLKTPKNLSY